MDPEQSKPAGRLNSFLPMIFGLIIGSAIAAATDQWWWATIGAILGALIGWLASTRAKHR